MTLPVLVTGDDFYLLVDLTTNELAQVVDAAADVKARVVSVDHRTALSAAVAQSFGADGADWGAGRIAVLLDTATTAAITRYGQAQIELQVSQGGARFSWFASVMVVKGQID
jgi:hypothetical protein